MFIFTIYGILCWFFVAVAHKSKTFAQICLFVDEHFGRENIAKIAKCGVPKLKSNLHKMNMICLQIRVGKLLRQMIDE